MGRIYRTSVWAVFIQIAVVFWMAATILRVYFLLLEDRWIPIINSTLIVGTFVVLAISVALSRWYRVEISNETIKGPNLWGGITSIPVAGKLSYKKVGFPGFRYLRIAGDARGAIWIALPVNDQTDLFHWLSGWDEKTN